MTGKWLISWGLMVLFSAFPARVGAHCDTMDGPVVTEAMAALDAGEVTPLLKWVHSADEAEVRTAFEKAVDVRSLGPGAKELADRYFLETLVRVHRAGEGAPYSGLKPAGLPDPGIALADAAIASGNAEDLMEKITAHLRQGIEERFSRVTAAKKHADESVPAGREYVAAYVGFLHYVEAIAGAVHGSEGHHAAAGEHR